MEMCNRCGVLLENDSALHSRGEVVCYECFQYECSKHQRDTYVRLAMTSLGLGLLSLVSNPVYLLSLFSMCFALYTLNYPGRYNARMSENIRDEKWPRVAAIVSGFLALIGFALQVNRLM